MTAFALSSFGRDDGVHVGVCGVLLLELRGRGWRIPRAGRRADLHIGTIGEVRIEDAVVPLCEELRVVVRRGAAHHEDVRLADLPRGGAVDHALPDQLADLDVVEADVVAILRPAGHEAVVVDYLHALRRGFRLDGRSRSRIERIDEEHRCAGGDVRLGLLLHRAGAAVSVVDLVLVGREPSGLEGLLQKRRVVLDITGRRRRVGEQDPDHSLALARKAFQLGHLREVHRQVGGVDLRSAGRSRGRTARARRLRSAAARGDHEERRAHKAHDREASPR